MADTLTIKKIRCDECKQWVEMEVDNEYSVFGFIRFKHPKHWFLFNWKEEKGFCSWLCSYNYIHKEYSKHHPDDIKEGR